MVVAPSLWRAHAIELAYGETERRYFEKRSTFMGVHVLEGELPSTDPDHVLQWIDVAGADALLAPASHRWAVREWLISGAMA